MTKLKGFAFGSMDDAVLGAFIRTLVDTQIDNIADAVRNDDTLYTWDREIKIEIPESWVRVCEEIHKAEKDALCPVCDLGDDSADDDFPETGEI
jgi:hypothetical protein